MRQCYRLVGVLYSQQFYGAGLWRKYPCCYSVPPMNEVTINSIIPPAAAGNLTNLIAERAHFEPERVIVSRPLGDGWQAVTAKEYEEEIKSVAKGLTASGINVGDRVAIMARLVMSGQF